MNCLPASPELGAPLIVAEFPRAYCDVNRASGELDSGMFDAALHIAIDTPSPRVTAGLGVIPRIVRDGAEIYHGKLSPREAELRLSGFIGPIMRRWRNWWTETVKTIRRCGGGGLPFHAVGAFGARYGAGRPLWRLGAAAPDRLGGKCFRGRTRFSIARNAPYAGGLHHAALWPRRPADCSVCRSKSIARFISMKIASSAKPVFEPIKRRTDRDLGAADRDRSGAVGRSAFPLAAE